MKRRSTQLKTSELESQQAQFFFLAFFSQLYKVTLILFLNCDDLHSIYFFILPFKYMKFIYTVIIDNKNNTIVL